MYRHAEDVAYDVVSSITGDGKIHDVQDVQHTHNMLIHLVQKDV